MQKFHSVKSSVIPVPLADVDTDMIIPAQYLTSVSREGYAENLFRRLKDSDKNFPMNKPEYSACKILLAGDNFGCGSSREHAVWAILGAGIQVVISTSFADIFSSNSGKNGLVLAVVKPDELKEIFEATKDLSQQLEIDLKEQCVTLPNGKKVSFPFDPFRKHCILEGLDDLDYLLSKKDAIDEFRKHQAPTRFFSSDKPNN